MKIGTVVTATDSNPLYTDFIPLFIRAWKHVLPEADIRILYIGESLPDKFHRHAQHIQVIPPLPNVHTAFQAQCIRLLYPREVTRNEGVLITDMDMLPMNRSYYVNSIASLSDDTFVVYRDVCLPKEISMCYNVARPAIWTELFGSQPTSEVLQTWAAEVTYDGDPGGPGWSTDQVRLVEAVKGWSGHTVILNDQITKFDRLDRGLPVEIWEKQQRRIRTLILQGYFADYHCLRPYSTYRGWNEWVVSCLEETRPTG